MVLLTLEIYSESLSDLEKLFDEFCKTPWPEGTSCDNYEIITDLACPDCDGDIRGDFVDGAWEYRCDLCRRLSNINTRDMEIT